MFIKGCLAQRQFMKTVSPTMTAERSTDRATTQKRDSSQPERPSDNRSRKLKDICHFQLMHFKRHDPLSFCHCGLWRIRSGYVRSLTWNTDGDLVPLGFWTVDDIVGCEQTALCQKNAPSAHPYEVQCLTEVSAEYLGSRYSFSKAAILSQVAQSNDLLRIAHCRQTETRLLSFICWLAKKFGKPTDEGYKVDIKLTHQEIAESIGITRVTVSRLIKVLERKGKIEWTTHQKRVNYETMNECCST